MPNKEESESLGTENKAASEIKHPFANPRYKGKRWGVRILILLAIFILLILIGDSTFEIKFSSTLFGFISAALIFVLLWLLTYDIFLFRYRQAGFYLIFFLIFGMSFQMQESQCEERIVEYTHSEDFLGHQDSVNNKIMTMDSIYIESLSEADLLREYYPRLYYLGQQDWSYSYRKAVCSWLFFAFLVLFIINIIKYRIRLPILPKNQ